MCSGRGGVVGNTSSIISSFTSVEAWEAPGVGWSAIATSSSSFMLLEGATTCVASKLVWPFERQQQMKYGTVSAVLRMTICDSVPLGIKSLM